MTCSNRGVTTVFSNLNNSGVLLSFDVLQEDLVYVYPRKILLEAGNKTYHFTIEGISPGHSDILAITNDSSITIPQEHFSVNVYKKKILDIVSQIIGWIFIISWGSSFYPQLYSNYERKCVIGLNFDYLALNIVGYISFAAFILNLYFNLEIQDEYYERYPRGQIPVKLNDVVYILHGTLAIFVTIGQCCVFERGHQKVSTTAKSLVTLIVSFYITCVALERLKFLKWLDFLYYCSYVKLAITLLKYIPQAYMNYKRKSTSGWSIALVFLDLNGGLFSILQMMLDCYNYDDWVSIFGNPTKFGLGILNALFHSFFIIQHFVFYKDSAYTMI
uniref:Cystinosin n=1 Tax=Photinus pyralis TaxID=7054 RepID=A0A1Y1MWJ5_PHOPY